MLKVVVMDGNAISRGLLTSVLTNGGHEVIGDSNVSQSGIARMVKLKPQLICIDLEYVEGDRMAALDLLRTELPKAILFLVSNRFDENAIREGYAHGVKGFIVKPFNSVQVLASIRSVVVKLVRNLKKTPDSPESASESDPSE